MKASRKNQNPIVHGDPEILGRTPVFVGTRVPLRNLIDYLEGGHSLDEFLDDFPSVSRDQGNRSTLVLFFTRFERPIMKLRREIVR